MSLRKNGLPTECFSQDERARTLELMLVELLDAGRFQLRYFSGYLQQVDRELSCGCPIGGLALAVGEKGGLTTNAFRVVADTGLATVEELKDLEQGYEFGTNPPVTIPVHPNFLPDTEKGPFFEAGVRIRLRRDACPSWNQKSIEERRQSA